MIAYWLVPAEPARSQLGAIIAALAQKYDAATFEPHLTVGTTHDDDEERAKEIVRRVASRQHSLELKVTGVGESSTFTKTLYLQLAATETVKEVSRLLSEASAEPNEYLPDPHVSVLYSTLAKHTRRLEAAQLSYFRENIRFYELHAIRFRPPITSRGDVENWRTIAQVKLAR